MRGHTRVIAHLDTLGFFANPEDKEPVLEISSKHAGYYESSPYVIEHKLTKSDDQAFLTTSVGIRVVTDKDLRKSRAKNKAARAARKVQRRKRK